MKTELEAKQKFIDGNNCAQSVLMAFADELNLDNEQAFKIAAGFGGGLAHNGKVCGAVSGAIMVLGLKTAGFSENSAENRELLNRKVNSFLDEFKKQHGSLDCKELIDGLSLMTPEGRAEVKERNLRNLTCTPIVESAAKIIANI